MRKTRKSLCFLLAGVSVLSLVLSACSPKKEETPDERTSPVKEALTGENPMLIPDLEKTEYVLSADGGTQYKIVLPENYSEQLGFASLELRERWKEATGGRIESVTENEIMGAASGRYIFLGKTSALPTDTDISESETGVCGYVLRTVGDDVFIAGYSDIGTLNGVYDFLKCVYNYRCYAPDVWQIDDDTASAVYLPKFDIVDRPDIDIPIIRTDSLPGGLTAGRRLRVMYTTDAFIDINGTSYHVAFGYLPQAKYMDPYDAENYHPEWYMSSGNECDYDDVKNAQQLCYTAHGDKESYGLMIDTQFQILRKSVLEGQSEPTRLMYAWYTQMDNYEWCGCDACKAEQEKYGTPGAALIKAANDVAKKLSDWIEEEGIGRRVNLAIYAYMNTMTAPDPVDDGVKLAKNVALFYAPIKACFVKPFTDECNASFAENLEKWLKVTGDAGLLWWAYDHTYYNDYLVPFYSFDVYQPNVEYMKAHNVKLCFSSNQYDNPAIPDWGFLKSFLSAELMWDSSQDVDKLIDDFFNVYFRKAAQPMRQWFDRFCLWYNYAAEKENFVGAWTTAGRETLTERFFPLTELETWLGYADEAYAAAKIYRAGDPELCQSLFDRICLETISPRYLVTEIHQGSFSSVEMKSMTESLDYDFNRLGILCRGEGGGRWY